VVEIAPPMAWDADGRQVTAVYSLAGNRLTVSVPHRDIDVRYPLVLDPVFVNVGEGTARYDFNGEWSYWDEWNGNNDAPFDHWRTVDLLSIWSRPGATYAWGDQGRATF
jgi:hypothetical protein